MDLFDLTPKLEQHAAEIHERSIIIDSLLPWTNLDYPKYMDQIREGGVTAGNVTVSQTMNFEQTLDQIVHYRRKLDENPDRVILATSVKDIHTAKETGKLVSIFGFQDGKPLTTSWIIFSYFEISSYASSNSPTTTRITSARVAVN